MRHFLSAHRENCMVEERGQKIHSEVNRNKPISPREDWEKATDQADCGERSSPEQHKNQLNKERIKHHFHPQSEELFYSELCSYQKITANQDKTINADF